MLAPRFESSSAEAASARRSGLFVDGNRVNATGILSVESPE